MMEKAKKSDIEGDEVHAFMKVYQSDKQYKEAPYMGSDLDIEEMLEEKKKLVVWFWGNYSIWQCKKCSQKFTHYYRETEDIFEAMKEARINPNECNRRRIKNEFEEFMASKRPENDKIIAEALKIEQGWTDELSTTAKIIKVKLALINEFSEVLKYLSSNDFINETLLIKEIYSSFLDIPIEKAIKNEYDSPDKDNISHNNHEILNLLLRFYPELYVTASIARQDVKPTSDMLNELYRALEVSCLELKKNINALLLA
jgi:hypothetical protein